MHSPLRYHSDLFSADTTSMRVRVSREFIAALQSSTSKFFRKKREMPGVTLRCEQFTAWGSKELRSNIDSYA